jgi:hypothetical protein
VITILNLSKGTGNTKKRNSERAYLAWEKTQFISSIIDTEQNHGVKFLNKEQWSGMNLAQIKAPTLTAITWMVVRYTYNQFLYNSPGVRAGEAYAKYLWKYSVKNIVVTFFIAHMSLKIKACNIYLVQFIKKISQA